MAILCTQDFSGLQKFSLHFLEAGGFWALSLDWQLSRCEKNHQGAELHQYHSPGGASGPEFLFETKLAKRANEHSVISLKEDQQGETILASAWSPHSKLVKQGFAF